VSCQESCPKSRPPSSPKQSRLPETVCGFVCFRGCLILFSMQNDLLAIAIQPVAMAAPAARVVAAVAVSPGCCKAKTTRVGSSLVGSSSIFSNMQELTSRSTRPSTSYAGSHQDGACGDLPAEPDHLVYFSDLPVSANTSSSHPITLSLIQLAMGTFLSLY
jgi:hypothetical protein